MKFVYGVFIGGLLYFIYIYVATYVPPPTPVYIINGERVSCGSRFDATRCGVHLTDCSNGRTYECVTNLVTE